MAPMMARLFCKLQAPPFHEVPRSGIPPEVLTKPIASPLHVGAWRRALSSHPDQEWVRTILHGMQTGFRIGLQAAPHCRTATSNTPSAREHASVVDQFIQRQVSQGYMLGPFPPHACSNLITSSIAVIPKKTPGKWRVIVDLSSPRDASVNDSTRRQYTHLAYSSVDDAAPAIHHLGRDSLMAKIDVKEAYRIIPVHPEDRPFLAVRWRDSVFVDCQLSFGLPSAPAIFSAVGEALEWVLRQRGVRAVVHYVDDFLLLGAPASPECQQALSTTLATCEELGMPIAPDKTEGPSTRITFLGIELDPSNMSASLPPDKLQKLRGMVGELSGAKVVRDRHKLESLIGHLVHASKVCPLGNAFLSALFTLKASMRPGQTRRMNLEARADLAWWGMVLDHWSGTSMQQFILLRKPDLHLYTDASGSWGCGAWVSAQWFQIQWTPSITLPSIALKELFPIVVAVAVWGSLWKGHLVMCHCDNAAVVAQVNRLHARDPQASHLLRCLAFFQALYECRLRATHIPSSTNLRADQLSRNRVISHRHTESQFASTPTQVPARLVHVLSLPSPDWTSPHLREMFNGSWQQVSQIQQ